MIRTRRPLLGSVVWAEVADANGFRKSRPAVVVSPTTDIEEGRLIRLAAITTRLPQPLPHDHVLLPWDRQGTARSGLRRRCAAVASWLVEVALDDIQVVGNLPAGVMRDLLEKIAALATSESSSPPSPSQPGPAVPMKEGPGYERAERTSKPNKTGHTELTD